ncbi:adenosylcobinamide-phosphate synthase CbiB [Aminobacter niigataensis]|uniref:adenosylcobinamide-phosphate synthase CbiB n=1 Tax=Aminobacter niigataensis TaxID=83265 RepID=UPI0024CB780A|nr:adenosylcobinamide-phosphate synthase CbiB [Aminobacter niigataensis]CAI2934141.1 Cobalamin biosynthesis protein CobD [Aminobacter niigataensis]
MFVPLAFLSLLFELGLGYPDRLVHAIGHPVIWIGKLISFLDTSLNRATDTDARRRFLGVVALAIIVAVPAACAFAVERLFGLVPFGIFLTAIAASSLVAQRSLGSHVRAVADALDSGGIVAGRKAVSQIVGRDPERLDEAGVSRAAIESLAENFSDGITAPAFWLAVFGFAGGAAYKAANTADSMIGHRTSRHEAFGWAAARFDDLINLPASRLTALAIVLAAFLVPGTDPGGAWQAVWRDARKHRSPNAGWPESAMAGALGLALAGPRAYGGVMVDDALMGDGGRREANAQDIRAALRLYWTADALMVGALGLIAAIFWL